MFSRLLNSFHSFPFPVPFFLSIPSLPLSFVHFSLSFISLLEIQLWFWLLLFGVSIGHGTCLVLANVVRFLMNKIWKFKQMHMFFSNSILKISFRIISTLPNTHRKSIRPWGSQAGVRRWKAESGDCRSAGRGGNEPFPLVMGSQDCCQLPQMGLRWNPGRAFYFG